MNGAGNGHRDDLGEGAVGVRIGSVVVHLASETVATSVSVAVVGEVGDGHAKREAELSVHSLVGDLVVVVVGGDGGGGRRWKIGWVLLHATLFGRPPLSGFGGSAAIKAPTSSSSSPCCVDSWIVA